MQILEKEKWGFCKKMSKCDLDVIDEVDEGYPHDMRENRRKEARDSGDGSRAWLLGGIAPRSEQRAVT